MSNPASLVPFKKGFDPRRSKGGHKRFTTQIREALDELAQGVDKNTGRPFTQTYRQLFIKRILNKAIVEGNETIIKLVWNYLDGMPMQELSFSRPTEDDNFAEYGDDELRELVGSAEAVVAAAAALGITTGGEEDREGESTDSGGESGISAQGVSAPALS